MQEQAAATLGALAAASDCQPPAVSDGCSDQQPAIAAAGAMPAEQLQPSSSGKAAQEQEAAALSSLPSGCPTAGSSGATVTSTGECSSLVWQLIARCPCAQRSFCVLIPALLLISTLAPLLPDPQVQGRALSLSK